MASTNKTTNYELSQYIGTDKPTYLTDYNQDMSKIDAGIHAAKSEADTNANAIGDLTSLTTTAKTSLVAAANEIDADVATNTNNIATNTSNIATNTTHIGTLTDLTTSSKTDLVVASNEINAKVGNLSALNTSVKTSAVNAINEVNGKINKFDLTNFKTYTLNSGSSDLVITNANVSELGITVASNSDGSLFKIYGYCIYKAITTGSDTSITIKNTGINPEEAMTINSVGFDLAYNSNNVLLDLFGLHYSIASNGDITIPLTRNGLTCKVMLNPYLFFAKDFGDTPINS